MQLIQGILFEPVGCLAEFPSEPFHEIAVRFFSPDETARKKKPSRSASRSYWHLLNLMQAAARNLDDSETASVEALELQAVDQATVFEDVIPALAELNSMGVQLLIASSLSSPAVNRFLERHSLGEFFSAVWTRDDGGIKSVPLEKAIGAAAILPEHTMFLTDTAEGLKVAGAVGVNAILMMNDPDEAKRLSMSGSAGGSGSARAHGPAGGIVSLHELPDFVRFVAAQQSQITSRAE